MSADRAPEAVPPSADDAALADIFGEGGTLARELPGFHFRPQQLEMAQAVARTIAARGQLVAEAGTGTGKTFAYLVPALLYGGKVIVSTGTKTLQDQLYERDLPLVRDALRVPVTIALLKGRANYICHYHLERASHEDRLPSRDDARHLQEDHRVFTRDAARRSRRTGRRAGECDDLAAGHVHPRQLPGPELRIPRRLLRTQGSARRARGRRRRRQPPLVLRRRDAARRRRVRASAELQHGDPRRSPSTARHGDAVLRRADRRRATGRAGTRRGGHLADRRARRAAASGRGLRARPRHPAAAPCRRQHPGEIRARRRDDARRLRRRARWPGGGARSTCHRNGALRRTRRGVGDDRPSRGGSRPPGRALARRGERHSGQSGRRRRLDPLDRRNVLRVSIAGVSAVGGAAVPAPGRIHGAGMDLHVGHAGGGPRLLVVYRAAWPRPGRHRRMGQSVRLPNARVAVRSARIAGAEFARPHGRGRRGGAAAAAREWRTRLPVVHDAARADARTGTACRGIRTRGPRLSAAGAGRRVEVGTAGALPPARAMLSCSAARVSGKAWTCPEMRCRWS